MIMALLAAFFLVAGIGGASGASVLTTAGVKQVSERAKVVIEDPDRSKAAQYTLKGLRNETKNFEKNFRKSGKLLTKAYANHTADSEEILDILADLNSSWEVSQQLALDSRFELRDSITEAEWSELFGSNQ